MIVTRRDPRQTTLGMLDVGTGFSVGATVGIKLSQKDWPDDLRHDEIPVFQVRTPESPIAGPPSIVILDARTAVLPAELELVVTPKVPE